VRRSVSQRVPQPGRSTGPHRRVSGAYLQPETPALVSRLLSARRVRTPAVVAAHAGGGRGAGGGMSFLRHGEIYPCDEGTVSRPRPRSSPWMSLQLVIPGRLLSSRARLRFTSRSYTANDQPRPTTLRQRTAKCSLTGCLSRGVHSTREVLGLYLERPLHNRSRVHDL